EVPDVRPAIRLQRFLIGHRGAADGYHTILPSDRGPQLRDWLVGSRLEYLALRGDLVPRAYRRVEVEVQVEGHRARSGEILGDHRVQQAGGDASLDDDAAEPGLARQLRVVVERVAVPRHLGEQFDVPAGHGARPASGVTDFHCSVLSLAGMDRIRN